MSCRSLNIHTLGWFTLLRLGLCPQPRSASRPAGARLCPQDQSQQCPQTRRVLYQPVPFILASLVSFWSNSRVDTPPKSGLPRPPRNPGVRDLIDAKRRWSSPQNPTNLRRSFRGWNERGYLPHRDEPGLIQFVTFRLCDCFPEALRDEWQHLLELEDNQARQAELESYLDKGRGECHLKKSQMAGLVENALRFFHGQRYDLRAWVIMPNHVHVLFKTDGTPLATIVGSWKKHSAAEANRLLKRRGAFWQSDYWDTFIRDAAHERKVRRYIETNPVSARLVLDPGTWPLEQRQVPGQHRRIASLKERRLGPQDQSQQSRATQSLQTFSPSGRPLRISLHCCSLHFHTLG